MNNLVDNKTQITISDIKNEAKKRLDDNWAFVQLMALKTSRSYDLIYTYRKDNILENIVIKDIKQDEPIESITDYYFQAFVFENEINDLYGLNVVNIAIDFKGNFFKTKIKHPMSTWSDEYIKRSEQQKKIKAAMEAKKKAQNIKEGV